MFKINPLDIKVNLMQILTFDIEEWWVYKNHSHYGDAAEYLPRINNYLNEILDLLDKKSCKATFFCLGDIAYRYPAVIKKIASKGHHIGCHSNRHRFLGELSAEEFADDTKHALDCIEDVIGAKVDAYRAPAFSIMKSTAWAIPILAEYGIKYDCSIFPAAHRYGGYPTFKEARPVIIQYKDIFLKEFPIPLMNVFGKRIAFSGGGYFRLLPYWIINRAMSSHDYIMLYFHIRDFDAALKNKISLSNVRMSPLNYFKSFYGISGGYDKFQKLLRDFDFVSVKQAANSINWETVPVVSV